MSLFESASLCVTPNGTKASKLYAIKPTSGAGDLSVTRATTATRVNSAGLIESVSSNVPRLDYSNGTCPSILVEPQRTNLALYSEQLDNAAWSKINNGTGSLPVVTSNYGTAPNGTNTADKIQFSKGTGTTSSDFSLLQQTNITLSSTGTFTIYLKSNTASNQNVLFYWAAGQGQVFTVTPQWQRFTLNNLTADTTGIVFGTRGGSGNFFNGGDNTLDISVWGAQLEAGSYATSYVPTIASSVTRNADVISKTGISSLIGQTEGTVFFDGKINALPVDGSLFGIQKNSSNFVIRFGSQGTNIYAQSYNGSANLFFEATPYTLGSRVKAAFAYKAGSYAFYINGVQIATGSNATAIPACDATMFNSLWGSFNDSLSFYSAAAIWKTRLSNAELATLTTI